MPMSIPQPEFRGSRLAAGGAELIGLGRVGLVLVLAEGTIAAYINHALRMYTLFIDRTS